MLKLNWSNNWITHTQLISIEFPFDLYAVTLLTRASLCLFFSLALFISLREKQQLQQQQQQQLIAKPLASRPAPPFLHHTLSHPHLHSLLAHCRNPYIGAGKIWSSFLLLFCSSRYATRLNLNDTIELLLRQALALKCFRYLLDKVFHGRIRHAANHDEEWCEEPFFPVWKNSTFFECNSFFVFCMWFG